MIRPRRRSILVGFVSSAMVSVATLVGVAAHPAAAAVSVTEVKANACGYFTNVGLFGGPQSLKGCGSGVAPTDVGYSPNPSLPSSGSATAVTQTDADGAKAQYGPAVIFGGRWPCNETGDRNCPAQTPQSGPLTAGVQGTPSGVNSGGSVTASADITLFTVPPPVVCYSGYGNPTCYAPGGAGPWPAEADEVHVSCTATNAGVTGTTTLKNAQLAHSTDGEGNPNPNDTENIPDNPAVNLTKHGVITNVGDVFSIVYNEQIVNSDGSLTVNAMHMYLFGPTAVGEMVKGQATCGTTPATRAVTDTRAPTCGTPVIKPVSPTDPTPIVPRQHLIGVFDSGNPPGSSRTVTASTVDKSTTITSATPAFQNADVGASVTGTGIPGSIYAPTRIQSVAADGLSATMTQAATATNAGVAMTVSRPNGLQSISNIQATNATVQIGVPSSDKLYLQFAPGQTGPLQVTATQTNTGKPMSWSFDATDTAGNVTHCSGMVAIGGVADFNGDAKTDVSVFRPSTGTWFVNGGATTFWGTNGDIPVPGDYNGDGKTDVAVFRPSIGAWFVNGGATTWWGTDGDIPVPGDYNGDGTTDVAVFRPSVGGWYINGQPTVWFGLNGDIPVPADYDGDGRTDVAVFRPSVGGWYINGKPTVWWGLSSDVPVPGDYDGNGVADVAIYRPSVGGWYINGQPTVFLGLSSDIPVPGDYNGDGTTDIAVFRPSNGVWFVNGAAAAAWGVNGDVPMALPAGDYRLFFT